MLYNCLYYYTTGGVVKDQATADPNASLGERAAIAVGSAAGGIKDATDNEVVQVVAMGVEKGAEKVQEMAEKERENEGDGEWMTSCS